MLLQLLTAPVSLPLAGFRFVLGQIADLADQELYDEDRIREQLLLLQLRLEEGEIDDDTYQQAEAEVLQRLRLARARRPTVAEAGGVEVSADLPE
jgi:hypothetical protein